MKSIPELSVDTQVLIKMLEVCEEGEMINYADLGAAIKADVRRAKRHLLTSAIKHLLKNNGMVFESVFGKGIKRLTASEVAGLGIPAATRIRRAARRCCTKLSTAKREELTAVERTGLDAGVSLMGFVWHSTSAHSQKRIAAAVTGDGSLSIGRTLEIFKQD